MKINDKRQEKKDLNFTDLKPASVYYESRRLCKYLMYTDNYSAVCLESGEVFDEDELQGGTFIEVNATLEIK
jgi:hypothetical protein